MIGRGTAALALLAAASVARSAPPVPAVPFTAAQADEGAALYAQRCAMCHGRQLEGTFEVPGLTGKFVANWAGRPLGDLSAYLTRAMPQFAPGSLSPDDSTRLAAFILRANGYPSGAKPLPAAVAGKVMLTPPPHASAR